MQVQTQLHWVQGPGHWDIGRVTLVHTKNHRIIKVGKGHWDHLVQSSTCHQYCPLNHVPKCHVYTFLDHIQGWWLYHLTGQPVPVCNHSFWEVFPNIQTEPFLVQLQAISSCRCYLGEEADSHFATLSFQGVVESSEVSLGLLFSRLSNPSQKSLSWKSEKQVDKSNQSINGLVIDPMRWFLGTGLPSFQQSYQSVTLFITGRKSQHQKSFLYRVTFEIYHGVVSPRADSKVTGGAVSWLLFCLLAPGVWERAINNTPRCGRVQLLKALNLLAAAVFQGGVLPPWSLQGQRCCRRRGGRSLERVGCVLGELLPWRDAKVRAWLKNLLPLLKSLLLYDIVFHRRRFS